MSENPLEIQWAEEERHIIKCYESVDNSLRKEENYIGDQAYDKLV